MEPQELPFEEALKRLEQTVQALEAGALTLEEATRLYEEGMVLARRCFHLLDTAELKVTQLQASFANQLKALKERGEDLAES